MRKLISGAFAAAAMMAAAAPASAATYVVNMTSVPGGAFGGFTNVKPTSGNFTDTFEFTTGVGTVLADGTTSILLALSDIDFTSVFLNGVQLVHGVNGTIENDTNNPRQSTFAFSIPIATGPNPQTLVISGFQPGNGTYSGNVYFAAAVPEPASWAMMIGGFGLVGGALRRRQSVKVRFAAA